MPSTFPANSKRALLIATALCALAACTTPAQAQSIPASAVASSTSAEKVIIDTDIGDDVDDAFAVALALRSPELQILGITTAYGDTETRAKLLDRILGEAGRQDIPIAVGVPTHAASTFTQRAYAEGGHFARASHPAALDFIDDQIRRYPGQITLITIGPLTNVGALIDKDPETFRKLKRIVSMGGSIYRGYGDFEYLPARGPQPEWNIFADVSAARKLFAAGVPLYLMPVDSTQIQLDETKRAILFRQGTPLTDALTLLYYQWGQQTPTLYDVMTIAYVLDAKICPAQPMRLHIDDKGSTLVEPGASNAEVCLQSDSDAFFRLYMARVAPPK